MTRQNKLLAWLSGIAAVMAIVYTSLPWLMAALIKQQLAPLGISAIQMQVDYPGWHMLRVHSLVFTVDTATRALHVEIPEVAVTYHPGGLLTGMVTQIRVPAVMVRPQSAPGSAPTTTSAAALPLAGLLSGRWLSQLPVREVVLEQLHVDARDDAKTAYTMQLSGQLQDAKLQINGDIRLPTLAQQPIVFSLNTKNTGEQQLLVSSIDQTAAPMLSLIVNPVASDRGSTNSSQIELDGTLTARVNPLLPMLVSWLTGADWAAGLEGDLNSQWQAQVSDAHWRVSAAATVHGLGGRWQEQRLPRGELTASVVVDPQQATLQATLGFAQQAVVIETEGAYQLASGHGHADFELKPVIFSEAGFVLSRLLKDWPYPFDVNAGQVSGSGRLLWQQVMGLQGVVQLEKLGGHYNATVFAGVSGELPVALAKGKVHTTNAVELRVDVVDVGFPVEKLEMRFALLPNPKSLLPRVQMQKLTAALLGGRMHSEPFELDFGRDKNAFVVQLEHIGLDEVMKLEQQEGLSGTGLLDGHIPIEISGKEMLVTQGQLSARNPGGIIRYSPTQKIAALAQSNQSVGMMVKALSDFRYQVLDVNADYKPGGDLMLQVRLEGMNPKWQGGQPIHLNLNLQENIPALLRSLQLSDEISGQVQKRYQNAPK